MWFWAVLLVLVLVMAEPLVSLLVLGIGAILFLIIKGIILLAGIIGWWGLVGGVIAAIAIYILWRLIYLKFFYHEYFDTNG